MVFYSSDVLRGLKIVIVDSELCSPVEMNEQLPVFAVVNGRHIIKRGLPKLDWALIPRRLFSSKQLVRK